MRLRRALLLMLLIGTSLPMLCGCQDPLFPENAPRTQFDAHDQLRRRYTPLEEPDVFGNPQPALRARLSHSQWQ